MKTGDLIDSSDWEFSAREHLRVSQNQVAHLELDAWTLNQSLPLTPSPIALSLTSYDER